MSIPFGVHIPFVANLGFTLEKFENGTSELHYSPRAEHHNSFGITHGGAVMSLLDVVMATAARSVAQEMGVVTIEMKTSFMRPARAPLYDLPLFRAGPAGKISTESLMCHLQSRRALKCKGQKGFLTPVRTNAT